MTIRAIVTDIEGTTTSVRFVTDTLFPWSRARLRDYVLAHEAELTAILDAVRAEQGDAALSTAEVIAVLEAWHDADRKIGPLKTLQGLIWEQGYADGHLRGHVYPDVAPALRRWQAAGLQLHVYSSGSVAAQRLLFGHSEAGDLTGLFSGWFDTAVGPKREVASYRAIAQAIGTEPDTILFLSDVVDELEAARGAGFATYLLARDGSPAAGEHRVAASFDTLQLEAD